MKEDRLQSISSVFALSLIALLVLQGCQLVDEGGQVGNTYRVKGKQMQDLSWYAPAIAELEQRLVEFRQSEGKWPRSIDEVVNDSMAIYYAGKRNGKKMEDIPVAEMSLECTKSNDEEAEFHLTLRGLDKELLINLEKYIAE